jgi:serine/threonine-protein kinase
MAEALEDKKTKRGETEPAPLDQRPTEVEPRDIEAKIEAQVKATERDEGKPKKDPFIGRVVANRFEIISKIGAGGMGAVYKARQLGMDRYVAVKVLLKEVAHDEKLIKRFKIEALAASRLSHPNTIRIYDFGEMEDGTLYIAMEFLEGKSLERVLRQEKTLSVRRTLHIIKQVAASLTEAHSKNIVHRDLKPDNVFLVEVDGDKDFVKVLDFGVAKLKEADKQQGTLTQAGMIFGTPRYMAPEQCSPKTVDHRADIYAIGIMAYEMLVGKPPFDADSPLAILMKHLQEKPKPMALMRPDIEVPEEVEAMVMRCIEKSPEKRFQTAQELQLEAARLEASLQPKFEKVVIVSGPRKLPTVITEAQPEIEAVEAPKKGGRKALFGALLAVLLLGGAGIVGAGIFSSKSDESVAPAPIEAPNTAITASIKPEEKPLQDVGTGKVRLSFESTPPGAQVFDGDKMIGTTPFSVDFEKQNVSKTFVFKMDGYKEDSLTWLLDQSGVLRLALQKVPKTAKPKAGGEKKENVVESSEPQKVHDLKKVPF